jgi:prevent-host-death family protein
MRSVGVRELKNRASDVLRRVRDRGEEIEVTYRGRAIARLVPVRPRRATRAPASRVWSDLDRLADEIGARWPSRLAAADAVRAGRRP